MYIPEYFKIKELVPESLLKAVPEGTLWTMFDDRLLRAADIIRKAYGSIFVNGRGLTNCGLRDPQSSTGAKYSPHKFGRALDLHIKSIEDKNLSKEDKIKVYNDIRDAILNIRDNNLILNGYQLTEEQVRILDCLKFEIDVSWIHIDVANRASRTFNP